MWEFRSRFLSGDFSNSFFSSFISVTIPKGRSTVSANEYQNHFFFLSFSRCLFATVCCANVFVNRRRLCAEYGHKMFTEKNKIEGDFKRQNIVNL